MLADFAKYIGTTRWHHINVLALIALIGIGLGVGFTVAAGDARDKANADLDRRLAIFNFWQMEITAKFTKATSLSATLAAFGMANATVAANLSAPAEDRVRVTNPSGYARLCKGLMEEVTGLTTLIVGAGAVISQMYPPNSAPNHYPLYESTLYRPMIETIIRTGKPLTTGPNKMQTEGGYGMHIWYPVFVDDVPSKESFWGTGIVMVKVDTLMEGLNVTQLKTVNDMDYALWFVDNATQNDVVILSNPDANVDAVRQSGMRIKLPVGQGHPSYFGMHPATGPVSDAIAADIAIAIVFSTVAGAVAIVALIYAALCCHFMFRHRHAPATSGFVYASVITLRGAQPIADSSPLMAVDLFHEFTLDVRAAAIAHGCYSVCEIGDRSVYVVSADPIRLVDMAKYAVTQMFTNTALTRPSKHQRPAQHDKVSQSRSVSRRSEALTSKVSEAASESSFMATTMCRPSVACDAVIVTRVYDERKDAYFYGTTSMLASLCGALDQTKSGEVAWTEIFDDTCPEATRDTGALTTSSVNANGAKLNIASWWKETGDERDSEDASMAMAILSDPYIKRMTLLVSQGKDMEKATKRKEAAGGSQKSGSSKKSADATMVTRAATILHIWLGSDIAPVFDSIRRIVAEEKGTVVSAHGRLVVAAFNLLSSGGHHQIRAANVADRLRGLLLETQFACSLHAGKVSALLSDGLVMCTGEAVASGKQLVELAEEMVSASAAARVSPGPDEVIPLSDAPKSLLPRPIFERKSSSLTTYPATSPSGICLLYCADELSAQFDCEAVDLFISGDKPRVVYRIGHRKSINAKADEWMYRLREEEDESSFALINSIFTRLADGRADEASRIWHKTKAEAQVEISEYSRESLNRLLAKRHDHNSGHTY